jgi:glycosyltransferase involved in cell wall biosynthesis
MLVSTSDVGGGAEKVAHDLYTAYRRRGLTAWLAVGHKFSDSPDILKIGGAAGHNHWARLWTRVSDRLAPLEDRSIRGKRLRRRMQLLGQPGRLLRTYLGQEDFDFPATWELLKLVPNPPDIVHAHNLHGGYFDLRALPSLSHCVPLVSTLHDEWTMSGHCAYTLGCERWRTGCGSCPDLSIYPSIRRDSTAFNWQRKREIYAQSRLYVATPSRWLMDRVQASMLLGGVAETRVIPNGVNLSVFRPIDRHSVRTELGLPLDVRILLFAAVGLRNNPFKDYRTLRAAVVLVAERMGGQPLLFVALGDKAPPEHVGQTEIRFVPFQRDPTAVARYYQAADLYVHAARADTFPNTVLEALACGTPVVATAVGGIPEQIESFQSGHGPDSATGILTPPADAETMAAAIVTLLEDDELRSKLSANAAADARRRFNLERQVSDYLAWYGEVIKDWRHAAGAGGKQ